MLVSEKGKIHDMTLRLDALYDTIVELEERIEDAKLRKKFYRNGNNHSGQYLQAYAEFRKAL